MQTDLIRPEIAKPMSKNIDLLTFMSISENVLEFENYYLNFNTFGIKRKNKYIFQCTYYERTKAKNHSESKSRIVYYFKDILYVRYYLLISY